ncbi:MAG: DUF853 domain-containing protein [Clostridia bacterium]|nr:DUF853 domain-containing protein [Clostridia bacterium]
MLENGLIRVGAGKNGPVYLLPQMANRHGLIAGATGTGKTVSLKVLAEGFSDLGVPVFLSDIKSDLSGMVLPGETSDSMEKRIAACGLSGFDYKKYPTEFWDVYGEQGVPVRATVRDMGPMLLSRMIGLNETQSGVMNILFRVANDEGFDLIDLKDLKAMLAYLGEHTKDYTLNYGNVSVASVGAIQRAVAVLEDQGGNVFFGEPQIDLLDWLRLDDDGRGFINILAADKLFCNPAMYSTFLLWMLTKLYELLPERGDSDKPLIVFFFDEAHLLFNNCSKALLEKIEQVVRLIRSKGVGVYFITQSPADIPMTILGQLGNRIQHALRAYTPLDQKAVKVAAQTFRTNPSFDTEEAITTLKTGEALLSFLDSNGAPGVVERATIQPPQSHMGPITQELRNQVIESGWFHEKYVTPVDRESAYELLSPQFRKQSASQTTPLQVQVSTALSNMSQTFMVYDPTTGQYVQKEMPTTAAAQPVAAQPSIQQPVVMQPAVPTIQVQPQIQAQPQIQTMPVMVMDPTTGQYVQQMVTMQLDPATGNYVPVTDPAVLEAQQKAAAEAKKAAEQAAAAAAKAAKEQEAADRRARQDELREERAERARKNDSVAGRVKNTAISTATRTLTNSLLKSLTKGISSLFGGKK